MQSSFFLGANSKSGFYSLYDDLIDLESANSVYVIKGSPGCGKSSFMRKIATHMNDAGHDVEQIFCSSDPDSLDGIVIPSLNIAFVDGTAPHVVEPKFPLVVEEYLNLGAFANTEAIKAHKREILDITRYYRTFFERVYRLTASAATLEAELFDIALGGIKLERLRKKAQGIISREIHGKGSGGALKRRFLSGITPKGYITHFDTVTRLCKNVFVLEDNFGLGMFLMQPILDAARKAGYDVFAAYSPLMPERLEHLIIPELSLAFVTSKKNDPYLGEYKRRIRIDAMIDLDVLRAKKKKITFSRKLSVSIIDEACNSLNDAKKVHDQIEVFYNPHIDFSKLYALADNLANKLLQK